ncbi:signal protein [Streptomyces sp. NPDC086549]|uniref:signal protein n=1 Tax=Streptomyces sp. NPDC086549 TaxID=3365752 RepID=UPI00381ACC39
MRGGGAGVLAALALVGVAVTGCGGEAGSGSGTGSGTGSRAGGKAEGDAKSPSARSEAVRLSPAELQSRWWTWAASEPEATNPVADEDGGDCARNQPDDVWFLAGTFGTTGNRRACSVPDGVPLAFPLVNLIGDEGDCADFMSTAGGSAVLDGKKVAEVTRKGDAITVTAVDGNPVTQSSGTFATTGCGLWVQVPAPEPGRHTLTIRGRSGDFATGVDYVLTVKGS